MHVDEVLAQVPVGSAALTNGTMMPDTGFPGFSTSFVGIDGNDLLAPSVYCSGTMKLLNNHPTIQWLKGTVITMFKRMFKHLQLFF